MLPSRLESLEKYSLLTNEEEMRYLARNDLFYLMVMIMGRADMNNDFLYSRCMDVQSSPNEMLDLWAREHYKSTIITVGKTIQDILVNPEITVGIFSHTRPIAKAFLRQIMREFENNILMQDLFPDILYRNPKRESRQWSEESGIIVKRQTNPKESTIEAWGVVDSQPTSKHFTHMVYDDIVTLDSTTSEMLKKTLSAWEMSINLGARGGIVRYIGTRYHANDVYSHIIKRKAATPRIIAATDNGRLDGKAVFLSQEELDKKLQKMGPYTYACQMLQNPSADDAQGFKREWIKGWLGRPLPGELDVVGKPRKDHTKDMNLYITVDPASKKKKTSDFTVMCVIGLGADGNYYLVDGIRDRLNLVQRWEKLYSLHRKYRPLVVLYEEYGIQADIEHYEFQMGLINYHFDITPVGGKISKEDRIRWLIPPMSSSSFFVPPSLPFVNYLGQRCDFIEDFYEEIDNFPTSVHDDVLDALSRIKQPGIELIFPKLGVTNNYDLETEHEFREYRRQVQKRNPLSRWLQ